jgi:AmiR/NasT family two-component response regulator
MNDETAEHEVDVDEASLDADAKVDEPAVTFTQLLELATALTMANKGVDADAAVKELVRAAHATGRPLIQVCADLASPFRPRNDRDR